MDKLEQLAKIEGFESVDFMLEASIFDSVCPSICTNLDCTFTADYEPDQSHGYCEFCNTQTVKSALVLAELI